MKQRIAIIVTILAVLALLVLLNTASYVSQQRTPDAEFNPDRSTYNAGATGTLALYDLLAESGRRVMRWREQPYSLLNADSSSSPSTFVIIGKSRTPFDDDEAATILKWVQRGGRLVIVDRRPDARLLPSSDIWSLSISTQELPRTNVDSARPEQMTAGVAPARPSQPTSLTRGVESIMPSRFAGTISIVEKSGLSTAQGSPSPPTVIVADDEKDYETSEAPPTARPEETVPLPEGSNIRTVISPAPVAHLEDQRGALLVDYPHGMGRIIVLSDPFVVANGGIRLADNLQLGINVIAGSDGLIGFDEYHQGRTAARNQLLAYFAGTPVLWMFAQGALVVLVLLWTRGRRFARPLPVPHVDRRSSLEFVASMAELQQRARAYDLAIENIYTRVRRVLVRFAGLSHNSPRSEIAERVAARSGKLDPTSLESLMRECEEAIQGAPVDGRKSLELVVRLREVERSLGLRMRSREARQAAEGLPQKTLL